MAKGNRKRSNTSKREAALPQKELKPIQPMHAKEAQLIQQFVNIAQTYAKLLRQEQQYDFILKSMEKTRTKIQKGELTSLNMPVAPNTTAPITDKKDMLEYMDDQIKTVKTALSGIKGQVSQKRDIFTETGLHLKDWCERRFGKYQNQKITGYRKSFDDEKVLFESEFEDLDLEAFEVARKKAIELNKEAKKEE